MKIKWEEPRIEVQKFTPNEYVAACYEGVCNVNGDIYEDTNKSGHYEAGIDKKIYKNTACGQPYEVTGQDSPEPQANAFLVSGGQATPVYHFGFEHASYMDSITTHERPNHS